MKYYKFLIVYTTISFIFILFLFLSPDIKNEYKNYKELKLLNQFARHSFSQEGEDLIIENIFQHLNIKNPQYLDIGAWNPVVDSNTYLFYRKGSRGVLVEPNPWFVEMIKNTRPADTIIPLAVSVTDGQNELDYYLINDGKSGWNTFSREQALKLKEQGNTYTTSRIKSITINEILKTRFKNNPDLLSIDIEGLDLAVLKSINWQLYRPKVICVETVTAGSVQPNGDISGFLIGKNYVLRGSTYINSIFVDKNLLK